MAFTKVFWLHLTISASICINWNWLYYTNGFYSCRNSLGRHHYRERSSCFLQIFQLAKVRFIKVSTFMILDFKSSFSVMFFTDQVIGKVLNLTLLGIFGFLMLVKTGQLVSLSQSKLESVGSSKFHLIVVTQKFSNLRVISWDFLVIV